jgi:hypothetical protein
MYLSMQISAGTAGDWLSVRSSTIRGGSGSSICLSGSSGNLFEHCLANRYVEQIDIGERHRGPVAAAAATHFLIRN